MVLQRLRQWLDSLVSDPEPEPMPKYSGHAFCYNCQQGWSADTADEVLLLLVTIYQHHRQSSHTTEVQVVTPAGVVILHQRPDGPEAA